MAPEEAERPSTGVMSPTPPEDPATPSAPPRRPRRHATSRSCWLRSLADVFGAAAMLALPGLAFIAVTVLTLCAPPLREIYGRRRATTAVPSAPGAGRRPSREVASRFDGVSERED